MRNVQYSVIRGQGGDVIVKSVNEEADDTSRLGIIAEPFLRIAVSLPYLSSKLIGMLSCVRGYERFQKIND
jgi:hypothetical protein